jgi:hypothetical protein
MSDEATKNSQFLEMDKTQSSFYQKLKAVGLPKPEASNYRDELYKFLHSECGVTETEFRVGNDARWDVYLDRWIHKHGPIEASPDIRPHVWQGTVWEFGEWIKSACKYLSARNSFKDALEQLCCHFVQKNGEPMRPHSVQESVNQRCSARRPTKDKV